MGIYFILGGVQYLARMPKDFLQGASLKQKTLLQGPKAAEPAQGRRKAHQLQAEEG